MSDGTDLEELRRQVLSQEQRLVQVEAERKILETLYQYCHSIDYGLQEEWLDCFTEDAVWYWTVRDATIQEVLERQGFGSVPVGTPGVQPEMTGEVLAAAVVGRGRLRRMVAGHTHAPDRWHKHCVMDTRVTVTGSGASAQSYFVRFDASTHNTGAYIRAFGRYLDELVRCPDGKWRIHRRHCELESHFDEALVESEGSR